jgi:arylsulfatase A-like enzyme
LHAGELSKGRAALFILLILLAFATPATPRQTPDRPAQRFPNVVILTIDTLRADHVSAYGYRRPTTPNIDRLLASGVRFTEARTVEPLTNPALASMLTSLYPHEHGATRNGLKMRPGLPSVARALTRRGYESAAFVSNWPLKDRISGLADHFGRYDEVFTRKRWLGLFKDEATAADLTDAALAWLSEGRKGRRPFLLWVHYVEPHAPYRLHEELARPLGIPQHGEVPRPDRYDTEIAFADSHLGRLLAAFDRDPELKANTLFVFAADHGESLGEHGYWGHGRNLYEPTLRIPLGMAWAGKIRPGTTIDAPAVNLDVAPTILGLAGLPIPSSFEGFDWTPVLQNGAPPPRDRVLWFEAHKGAVLSSREATDARRKGLLEVGLMVNGRKQILRLAEGALSLFDLAKDPRETRVLAADAQLARRLQDWMGTVQKGLIASDRLAPAEVGSEDAAQLRALGYLQ